MKMLEKFNELYNKIISEDTEWKDNAQFERDNKFLLNTLGFENHGSTVYSKSYGNYVVYIANDDGPEDLWKAWIDEGNEAIVDLTKDEPCRTVRKTLQTAVKIIEELLDPETSYLHDEQDEELVKVENELKADFVNAMNKYE